ncbi:MAG TPA: hypothetical protein VIN58_00470 [Roseateles sp.]
MTEQPQHTEAAARRRVLAIVFAFGVIGVGTWLHKRPPAAEAPLPDPQAQASQPASSAAPAVPAPVASMAAPAAPAQTPASAPDYGAMARKAQEQALSPADALRKVQLALGGGTPKEVLEAAQLLQGCAQSRGSVEALHAMRDRPDDTPEIAKKMLEGTGGVTNELLDHAQREARRCQVFDAATMARRNELFQRAWEGGAEGGAAAYLSALQNPMEKVKADPALIAKLQADVRKAAAGGDANALLQMAMATGDSAQGLGVTPVQQAGYKAAWKAIQDEKFPGANVGTVMEKTLAPVFNLAKPAKPLTAAEQAAADALAQQVLEAWRRKQKEEKGG